MTGTSARYAGVVVVVAAVVGVLVSPPLLWRCRCAAMAAQTLPSRQASDLAIALSLVDEPPTTDRPSLSWGDRISARLDGVGGKIADGIARLSRQGSAGAPGPSSADGARGASAASDDPFPAACPSAAPPLISFADDSGSPKEVAASVEVDAAPCVPELLQMGFAWEEVEEAIEFADGDMRRAHARLLESSGARV